MQRLEVSGAVPYQGSGAVVRRQTVNIIHSCSALEAGLAGTRAQLCDRYGSGTLHPGQVLGGSLPLPLIYW